MNASNSSIAEEEKKNEEKGHSLYRFHEYTNNLNHYLRQKE